MEIVYKHFASIDSTNTWSKQHAHEFERNKLTLVTADEQTVGRGRFNRNWISPAKQNIYATFSFFVDNDRTDIINIPQVLALSVIRVLESLNFKPHLKWPNDVMLSNKKVGGILCETTPLSDAIGIILGIGLNVNMPLDVLQTIDQPATSLMVEKKILFDVEILLQKLVDQFHQDLEMFLESSMKPFINLMAQKPATSVAGGSAISFL